MNDDDIDDLIAGRALHALSAEDDQRLDAALAADPALRDRLDREIATAALLAEATPEVTPPPHVRAELLARITGGEAPSASEEERSRDQAPSPRPDAPHAGATSRRRVSRRGWFTLAASIAVVAAIGFGALTLTDLFDRGDAVVALERIEAADDARTAIEALPDGGSLEMHWSYEMGEAVVVADDLPTLPGDRVYEMWFVRGETPVSAGTIDVSGGEPALLEGELAPGDIVAVTVEQEGGSPTGLPTTEPLAAIPTG